MNKIKIIFVSIVLLVTFFMSYNVSLAAGCCITATSTGCNSCVAMDSSAGCTTGNFLSGACSGVATNCCSTASSTTSSTISSTTSSTVSSSASGSGSTSFTNPLTFNSVEGLLANVLSAIQKIVVTLALVFITIGGIMILVSAGSPDTAEQGKKAIYMAVIGLAIGIGAPAILKELSVILGWTPADASVSSALSLSQIALNVLQFLLGIAGVLALIMLVVGGIMYLTSAGDEERIDNGKKIFKNALIGVIIIMTSMVLVRQIAAFFAI